MRGYRRPNGSRLYRRLDNTDDALEVAREAVQRLKVEISPIDVQQLVDAFSLLDEKLSAGGDLPDDWHIDESDPADDDDDEGEEDDGGDEEE